MTTGISAGTNYSPSLMSTFEDCQARAWHERHDDGSGLLPSDPIPAAVGSAIHDALMAFHRDMEGRFITGTLPGDDEAKAILARDLDRALFRARLEPSIPVCAERMRKALPGVQLVAEMVIEDLPRWVRDDVTGLWVWTEARLDHGPQVRAVELAPGVLSATRPDVIGIRQMGGAPARVVVKDYKSKTSPVDPEFDNGILLRAIWAMLELQNPRCRWFVAGRTIEIDRDFVDVETINVMHAGAPEFFIRRTLSAAVLARHRERLIRLSEEMSGVLSFDDVADVSATPGYLCESWCPVLHRCRSGQAHVRKYAGEERLRERLEELD